MSYEAILYEKDGPLVTITLNRPQMLNAINPTMESELYRALDEADADPEVRAIILTGAGRAFSAGFDVARPCHVEAGAESAPRAREDDRPRLGVRIGLVQGPVQLGLHGGVDRVEQLGAVQRDRDQWPMLLVQNRLVGHFDLHPSRGRRAAAGRGA